MVCWLMLCVLFCAVLVVVIAQELNERDACETEQQSLAYIFEKMVLRTWLKYPAHYGYEVRTSTFDNPWRNSLSPNDRIRWDHYWTKKEEARWAKEELEAKQEAEAQAIWEAMPPMGKFGQWLLGKDRGAFEKSSRRIFYFLVMPLITLIALPIVTVVGLGGVFILMCLLINGFAGM